MQDLTTTNDAPQTMSSREIADHTKKHHFHVTTDIERMLGELDIDATKFRGIYRDSRNGESGLLTMLCEQRKMYSPRVVNRLPSVSRSRRALCE